MTEFQIDNESIKSSVEIKLNYTIEDFVHHLTFLSTIFKWKYPSAVGKLKLKKEDENAIIKLPE